MKNIINYFITTAVVAYLTLFSAGCGDNYKTKKTIDPGRNPNNNFIENLIADLTTPLVGCLEDDTQSSDKCPNKSRCGPSLFMFPDPWSSPHVQEQREGGNRMGWYSLIPSVN